MTRPASVLSDFRFALRAAARRPGWTAAAVATLALGIGANAVVFSVVSGVLLRPLPFADPGRLIDVKERDRTMSGTVVYYADLQAWNGRSHVLESTVVYGVAARTLEVGGDPERISTVWSERGLFEMLGVPPLIGRTIRGDDPPNVAVIAESLWRRRFGSDPGCLGQAVTLDGQPYTIVGVMPSRFQFPYRLSRSELWIPWTLEAQRAVNPNTRVDSAVARLRAGISIEAARRELAILSPEGHMPVLTPLSEAVSGSVRAALGTLGGAVGLVLLIACANVTNLLLARSGARRQEFFIRAAIGASRGRILRQLVAESLLLGVAGGLLALVVAVAGTPLLVRLAAFRMPRSWEIGIDWRVFAFLLAASLATGVLCGILPGLAAGGANLRTGRRPLLRDAIAVGQVAVAFALLIGAGVLLQAFLRLARTPTGIVQDGALTMRLSISLRDWSVRGAYGRYLAAIEERVRQIPGVRQVGAIQYLPLENYGWWARFAIEGRPPLPVEQRPTAELRYVTPGYFSALGIPLRKGRFLTERDTPETPVALLVNEALARAYFPGEDPVGRKTDRGIIVGVVGDVRSNRLDRPASPEIYYAFVQNTAATSDAGVSLIVSTWMQPENIANDVRRAIRQVNPRQAVSDVRTMRQVVSDSLADVKLYTTLMGIFAGLALALSIGGVYSVVAHGVAARTREIGIRVALGATGRRIFGMILGHGLTLTLPGLLIGAIGALAGVRALRAASSSVESPGPEMIVLAAIVLASAALAACVEPASRAMEIDPNSALKHD